MFRNVTLFALGMTLLGFISCSTVDKAKSKTRDVASGASTVDSSVQDLERTEETLKRIKNRFERR